MYEVRCGVLYSYHEQHQQQQPILVDLNVVYEIKIGDLNWIFQYDHDLLL